MLRKRLEEELELRAVFESALEQAPGTLTSFPRHLPISVRTFMWDSALPDQMSLFDCGILHVLKNCFVLSCLNT